MGPSASIDFRSALQVAPERIARLNERELGELMGQLLRAQSHRCGAPVSELRINTEEKAADGGADAWSGKPERPDAWLGDAETCWQLKAGDAGEPAKVKKEISKRWPSESLQKGGRFVLVASGSTSGKEGEDARLKTLTTEAEAAGLPTDRIAVFGSERLTEWVNQHPAIAARWANRPKGLRSFQEWPTQEHQDSWQASGLPMSAIATYRQALDPTAVRPDNVCLHLHLHGPPGAGKTRLALELCKEAPWADFVVYVQRARASNVLALLTQVASEHAVRCVVVADDTPADLLIHLRDALEPSEGRIRLITIGNSHSPYPRRIRGVELRPLSTDCIQELVGCWYPAMPAELVQMAVNLAAGNPRLARLAADALTQNPALTTATLNDQPEIRKLRAFIRQAVTEQPVTEKVSDVIAPALPKHDGCWRLLITIRQAKMVEGGNAKTDQRFIVDPLLVNPEASSRKPLQQLWETVLPSAEPVSFSELENVLIELAAVATRIVSKLFPRGHRPELLMVLSLENTLIVDEQWVGMVRTIKQSRSRQPVVVACLCRQADGSETSGPRWLESGNVSSYHSRDILEILNEPGSQLKNLRWLLIEDHDSSDSSMLPCKQFEELDRVDELDRASASAAMNRFFARHHALLLRLIANGANFAERVEKILDAGIPFFLLEFFSSVSASDESIASILEWSSERFVPDYCKKHRMPEVSEDYRLAESYLFWEDHRYPPFENVLPMQANVFLPFNP